MRFKILFHELRRRHVFKAGVAYLVVAWLIVQVLSILIPAFEIPQHFLPFSIVVLLVGFPIWLVVSWFYDITEDGIVRTRNIEYETESTSRKNLNLNKVIIAGLSVAVILLLVNTFRIQSTKNTKIKSQAALIPDFKSSVAVLAFADMSPDHDKEYFADGMSEEILNKLARCKDLKVIGRTSSFSYKNKEVTLDVIGEELEVGYILEGSVRQSGDVFRITVQLIDVSDGAHIWSDTFDRTVEDVLLVQEEIAAIVAERLEVTLLNKELRERKIDPEAYKLYLQANDALHAYHYEAILQADSLIRRSLELDDTYAPSWALLSQTLFSQTYDYFLTDKEIGHESGVLAAKKAIELDSSYGMGYVWLANYSWRVKQVVNASSYLDKALELEPNNPQILGQAGNWAMQTNRLVEAEKLYDKALIMDPKNILALRRKAFIRWVNGDLKTAESLIHKVYEYGLVPYLKNYELSVLYTNMGDFNKSRFWMEKETNDYLKLLMECRLSAATGDLEKALLILEEIIAYPEVTDRQEFLYSEPEHYFEIACLYAYLGDNDNAFHYLDQSFEHVVLWPEWLFTMSDFNTLYSDPRWEKYLVKLGKEYNYDFLKTD